MPKLTEEMSSIKINYSRKPWLGVVSPFYHSSFEIKLNSQTIKRGFYAKSDFLWPISILIPMPGELRSEIKDKPEFSITLKASNEKIKKVIALIKDKKYNWKVYSALFRNCFHWRNQILEEAQIKHPIKDWF